MRIQGNKAQDSDEGATGLCWGGAEAAVTVLLRTGLVQVVERGQGKRVSGGVFCDKAGVEFMRRGFCGDRAAGQFLV